MREVVVVDATEAPPLPMQVLCCVHGLNAHLRAHKGRKSTTTLYLVCTITYTPGGTADDPPAPQRSCAGVGISCLTALARPAPSHRTTAPPHPMHPHAPSSSPPTALATSRCMARFGNITVHSPVRPARVASRDRPPSSRLLPHPARLIRCHTLRPVGWRSMRVPLSGSNCSVTPSVARCRHGLTGC